MHCCAVCVFVCVCVCVCVLCVLCVGVHVCVYMHVSVCSCGMYGGKYNVLFLMEIKQNHSIHIVKYIVHVRTYTSMLRHGSVVFMWNV